MTDKGKTALFSSLLALICGLLLFTFGAIQAGVADNKEIIRENEHRLDAIESTYSVIEYRLREIEKNTAIIKDAVGR